MNIDRLTSVKHQLKVSLLTFKRFFISGRCQPFQACSLTAIVFVLRKKTNFLMSKLNGGQLRLFFGRQAYKSLVKVLSSITLLTNCCISLACNLKYNVSLPPCCLSCQSNTHNSRPLRGPEAFLPLSNNNTHTYIYKPHFHIPFFKAGL